MGKIFRIYEQATKKQKTLRPLHEFLDEQQEPFLLQDYLLDRPTSTRRYPNHHVSKEIGKCLIKLKRKLLNPGALRYNETDPNPWVSSCCFLEMNLKPIKKRRRSCGGTDRNAHLDIFWHSEEYHTEGLNMNVKRLKFTVQERKTPDTMQVESAEGLNKEHRLASIQKYEGSLSHYTRIFGFKKENKVDKENKKQHEDEKIVKCSLFKLILRKLTLTRESLPNIHTHVDIQSDSKSSKATRKLSHGKNKADHCNDDEDRLRVSATANWDSFGEVAPGQSDHSRAGDKGCVSFKPPGLNNSCISATEPDNYMKLNESFCQEVKLGNEYNHNLQSILKKSNPKSSELCSLSNRAIFYSCSDGDIGSASTDKLSSDIGLKESTKLDFQYPEGIDYRVLEASCSSGYLSLHNNDFGARDYRSGPRYVFDQSSEITISSDSVINYHKHFNSPNDKLQQDSMLQSPPFAKSFGFLEVPGDKKIPVNPLVCKRDYNLKSRQTSCSHQGDQDDKNDCIADDHQGENSDVHIRRENMKYASVALCRGESKQLGRVSVLKSPPGEGTPVYGQHIANLQNPLTLEDEASGKKIPSESESRNYILQDQGNSNDLQMRDCNKILSQLSFKCPEGMDWDKGRIEEYIRKALNSSETISYLIRDINERELQGFAGCRSPTHAKNPFPLQCSRRKQVPRQSRMFLLESVKEMLESPAKQYAIEFLTESFIKEGFGPEQLAKAICNQICAWKKPDANIAEWMVHIAWKKEEEEWTKFREETKEIGIEIEVLIFRVLIEELVEDLAHLQI